MITATKLRYLNDAELIGGVLPPHQEEGVRWLDEHPRSILADGPGLGKTIQAGGQLALLHERDGIPSEGPGRALIVVPGGLVEQMASELGRFIPGLPVTVHTSQSLARKSDDTPSTPIEIVGYDLLKGKHLAGFIAKRFGIVIFDEASMLKTTNGARLKAAREVAAYAHRVHALTATPIENDLEEFHAIASVLGAEGFPPASDEWWARFIQFSEYEGRRTPIGIKRENLRELRELIKPYVLRRTVAESGLPIPSIVRSVEYVPLLPAQERAYRQTLRATARSGRRTRANRPRNLALQRHHGLEAACSAVDGVSATASRAVAFVLANPGRKIVIWTEHPAVLDVIERELGPHGILCVRIEGKTTLEDRSDIVNRFRDDPQCQVLIGTSVLERGLNLQFCDVIVSLGSTWNPAREEQLEGRIRRAGSAYATVYHVTILTDTEHERHKLDTLERKAADAACVLDLSGSTLRATVTEEAVEPGECAGPCQTLGGWAWYSPERCFSDCPNSYWYG